MSSVTSAARPSEHATVAPPRWRWYHVVAFYVVVQVLTFGLSGLVSLARGNRGQSLREAAFGDVSYFERLKQVKDYAALVGLWPGVVSEQHLGPLGNLAGTQQATTDARADCLPGLARSILGRLRAVQCRLLQPAFAAQCPDVDICHVPADHREWSGGALPDERYQGGALPGHVVHLVDRGADRCALSGAVEQG